MLPNRDILYEEGHTKTVALLNKPTLPSVMNCDRPMSRKTIPTSYRLLSYLPHYLCNYFFTKTNGKATKKKEKPTIYFLKTENLKNYKT